MQLIWHIGNRHMPCQIEKDRIFIQYDKVIRTMILKLGGKVKKVLRPCKPEEEHMELVEHIAINTKIKNKKVLKESIKILQTWLSPSFPVGSNSYSHGLEAMRYANLIKSK